MAEPVQEIKPVSVSEHHALRMQQRSLKQRKIKRQRILAAAAAVVVLFALLIGGDLLGSRGRIHRGAQVNGIDLGGKTRAQARSFLTAEFDRAQKRTVTVTYDKQSWQIKPVELGIRYDVDQMVSDAYQIGRQKNLLRAAETRFLSYFKPQPVMLRASLEGTKAADAYAKIIAVTDKAPVNATVNLAGAGGTFSVTAGSDGRELQKSVLTNLLVIAGISDQKTVAAPVKTAARAISKAEAQEAAQVAENAVKDAIMAKYGDKSWQLDSGLLRKLFVFKLSNDLEKEEARLTMPKQKSASGVVLVPVVASSAVAKHLIPLMGATVGTAPVPASFSVSNGAVTIQPSKNGLGADPAKLAQDLATQMQADGGHKTVIVVTHEVAPDFTTQKAEELGIKERISTYTTYFSAGNPGRLTNITLLAKALDGTIVMPDTTFSLNGTVGEANAAKGYQEAGAIVDGVLESQVGGGICQVNTTLFNAALLSGVKITERVNHSLFISSYPLGRDAAVSWPGPDFKFVNTIGHPILIATSSTKTSVTVSFYGVDPGYTIEISPGTWLSRTPAPEQRVDDPTLPVGTEVVKQQGRGGGKVAFTQTVTKDGRLVYQKTYNSVYKTEPTIIQVGTKPGAGAPTPVPTTPSKPAETATN
ncbi:MAG: VanW family protein [Actinomycetia bacterium]|nr:VanW family protein [Actinomycetes bacterium]